MNDSTNTPRVPNGSTSLEPHLAVADIRGYEDDADSEHAHEHLDSPHDLPSLPPFRQKSLSRRNHPISPMSPNVAPPQSNMLPTFTPLSQSASRLSNLSNRTFVDAQGAITALEEIGRVETRMSRVGKGYTVGQAESKDGDGEDGKMVAVQITPDGQEITFPDGGKEAWLCLIGAFAALFVGFGLTPAAGAYQTYYHDTFLQGYSPSQISWIGSVSAFVAFGLAPFSGSLFDLFGHKPLISVGTFLLVLGYCLLSLCSKYYQLFLCHATLIPIGQNLMFICPVGVVSQWFAVRRGMAFGIIMSGGAAGSALWPLVWSTLPQRIGFGWTMRFIALCIALFGIAAYFLMKTRLPPKPPGPFFHLKMYKIFPYTCLGVASFTWAFAFSSWLFFIGTYGKLTNLSLAPYFLVILNAGSFGGRLATSLVADRVGVYNLTTSSLLVMSICFWAWLGCKTTESLIALNVVFGFFSGTYVSLQAPMVTRLVDDMRLAGTSVGQILLWSASGQLVGPPIFGALLGHGSAEEQLGNFKNCLFMGASVITLSMAILIIARRAIEPKIWVPV